MCEIYKKTPKRTTILSPIDINHSLLHRLKTLNRLYLLHQNQHNNRLNRHLLLLHQLKMSYNNNNNHHNNSNSNNNLSTLQIIILILHPLLLQKHLRQLKSQSRQQKLLKNLRLLRSPLHKLNSNLLVKPLLSIILILPMLHLKFISLIKIKHNYLNSKMMQIHLLPT